VLKREPPPAPESAKPLFLVLANTHNARSRQAQTNSEEANHWLQKASDWIRQAQALTASSNSNGEEDVRDGLAWLEQHMLDKKIPSHQIAAATPGTQWQISSRAESVSQQDPRGYERMSIDSTSSTNQRFSELQIQYHFMLSQLEAAQSENRRLREKVHLLDEQASLAEARLRALGSTVSQEAPGREEADAKQALLQAEAERLRLLAIINEERIAKRRAEDAEQEERSVRRKLEDKLWMSGARLS
jgi:hypothetical protein